MIGARLSEFGVWKSDMKTIQTSFPPLSFALGLKVDVYLKREDQHKYGSHKGRSLPLMIKKYSKQGPYTASIGGPYQNFVISSSGNAALAAIYAVQAHNRNNSKKIKLQIFIGQNINPAKLKKLLAIIEDPNIKIEQTANPKQSAFQLDKEGSAKNLRQSTDDLALEGYFELAEELSKISNLQAVFIPTSSGTTAQALGQAFQKLNCPAQIHIVQTTACHPIAATFNPSLSLPLTGARTSIADAIVDNIAHRKGGVLEIIKKSSGSGWIVTDEEIKNAISLVEETCNIKISPNSALSVAGLKKAVENGWQFTGSIVCLITGL